MSEVKDKNIWLVIEKYVYSNSTPSHSVKKTATSVEEESVSNLLWKN